jgi:PKD repeat protein
MKTRTAFLLLAGVLGAPSSLSAQDTDPSAVITLKTRAGGAAFEVGHPILVSCADSTGVGAWRKAHAAWNFDATDAQPTHLTIADPRPGKTARRDAATEQEGWTAAYVYDAPGTYTIRLTLTDADGRVSTDTETVTIGASTRAVYHFDATSGDDSRGNGSVGAPFRSFDKAHALATASDNVELRFRRGQHFDSHVQSGAIGTKNVVFTSYGEGAKPTFTPTVVGSTWLSTAKGECVVFRDMHVIPPRGSTGGKPWDDLGSLTMLRDVTVDGSVEGDRFGFLASPDGRGGHAAAVVYWNVVCGAVQNYHHYVQDTGFAVWIGCDLRNPIKEHGIRVASGASRNLSIIWSYFERRSGKKTWLRIQWVDAVSMVENHFHNGAMNIGFDGDPYSRVLLEGNYIADAVQNGVGAISMEATGSDVGIRNNVFMLTRPYNPAAFHVHLHDTSDETVDDGLLRGVFIANNSIVNTSGVKGWLDFRSTDTSKMYEKFAAGAVDTGGDTIMIEPRALGGDWQKEGRPVRFLAGDLPAPLSAGTTYYLANVAGSNFQLAATRGGGAIDLTSTGSGGTLDLLVLEDFEVVNTAFIGEVGETDCQIELKSSGMPTFRNTLWSDKPLRNAYGRLDKVSQDWAMWTAGGWSSNDAREDIPSSACVAPEFLPDPALYPVFAAHGRPEPGAQHRDYHGRALRLSGTWRVGAVQAPDPETD